MLNGVAALGLITVATIIVDQIMLKCLPRRAEYNDAKYQETLDITDAINGGELFSADEAAEA